MTDEDARAIAWIMARLRNVDCEEIVATHGQLLPVGGVIDSLEAAALLGIIRANDREPVAFIAAHTLTPSCVAVSMLATDLWPRVALRATRFALRSFGPQLLKLGFRRAECRAMASHIAARRWLRMLGFKEECGLPHFGAGDETFIQLAWRLKDHVHVQSA